MIQRLLLALVESKNEAADAVLLEALRLGNEAEQRMALDALLERKTVRGLSGVVAQYKFLPESLQLHILNNVKHFHHALRECGRSDEASLRIAAMKLIALGRQGKLAYVLSENLHGGDDALGRRIPPAAVGERRDVGRPGVP